MGKPTGSDLKEELKRIQSAFKSSARKNHQIYRVITKITLMEEGSDIFIAKFSCGHEVAYHRTDLDSKKIFIGERHQCGRCQRVAIIRDGNSYEG